MKTVTYGIVVATATRLVDGERTHFVTVLTVDGEEVEYMVPEEDVPEEGFKLGKDADVVRITEDDGTNGITSEDKMAANPVREGLTGCEGNSQGTQRRRRVHVRR
jgi:hypothetical protein